MQRLVVDEVIIGGNAEYLMVCAAQRQNSTPHRFRFAPHPQLGET